jgi:hypothetical protein
MHIITPSQHCKITLVQRHEHGCFNGCCLQAYRCCGSALFYEFHVIHMVYNAYSMCPPLCICHPCPHHTAIMTAQLTYTHSGEALP